MDFLKDWHYDWRTALVTIVVVPVVGYLLSKIAGFAKKWSGFAVDGALYWTARWLKRNLARVLTLKRYCRLQMGKESYSRLHVPSRLDVDLDIDKVYITLTMDHQGSEQAVYSHRDLLTAGNRIRVVGDPGSGKSSLVKRLFRDACVAATTRSKDARLPVLLELKHLDAPQDRPRYKLGEWLYAMLRDDAAKCAVYQMSDCFDAYAQTHGLLVLLDGLDEVATTQYAEVQAAILGLSRKLAELSEHNVIVLTTRTQFHQQVKDCYHDDFPAAMYLRPFTPTDVYEFLNRWPFRERASKHVARIFNELTDRPTLREMCSNPLILAMYVADDQASKDRVVPESRTEFYQRVTDELMIYRRHTQLDGVAARAKVKEQRESILGRLAFEHLLDAEQPSNSLRWTDALRVVREVTGCKEDEAASIFRDISKETGLVTEERPEQTFRFIHLTFCEFLAAHEAVHGRKEGWAELVSAHKLFREHAEPHYQSRLVEVLPFACGLLPRVHRPDAISDLAALGDTAILARSFLETKLYDHGAWPRFVETETERLLHTIGIEPDEEFLRRLHLFSVVVHDADICGREAHTVRAEIRLEALFNWLINGRCANIGALLSAYASQDAVGLLRLAELCHIDLVHQYPKLIIKSCDQPHFLSLALQQALSKKDRLEDWLALFAEAALRSRPVAEWLRSQKESDELRGLIVERGVHRPGRFNHIVGKSLYSQILDLRTFSGAAIPVCCEIFRIIRDIRAKHIRNAKLGKHPELLLLTPVLILLGFVCRLSIYHGLAVSILVWLCPLLWVRYRSTLRFCRVVLNTEYDSQFSETARHWRYDFRPGSPHDVICGTDFMRSVWSVVKARERILSGQIPIPQSEDAESE